MSARVVAFHAGQRLSPLEQELLDIVRVSPDPQDILRAAQYAAGKQQACEVWMRVERLCSGKLRTFWNAMPGGYKRYEGRVFTALDEVIEEAVATLQDLDSHLPVEVLYMPRHYRGNDCCVRRGRFRVEVNGLPDWMVRAWRARPGAVMVSDKREA